MDTPSTSPSQPSVSNTPSPMIPKKSHSDNKLTSGAWLFIVLFVGIILFFVGRMIYSQTAGSPDALVLKAFDAIESIESGEVEYQVRLALNPSDVTDAATLVANGSHVFDQSGSAVNVALSIEGSPEVPLIGELPGSLGMSVVTQDELVYVKFSGLPTVLFFNVGQLNDQWIVFEPSATSELYESFSGDSQATLGDTMRTDTQKSSPYDVYREYPFFVWQRLDDELLNGYRTYHLVGTIDIEQYKKFIQQFNEELRATPIPEEDITSLSGAIVDFWIDKNTFVPRKIQAEFSQESDESTDSIKSFSITATMKSYNQPVAVEVPSESLSAEEAMQQVMSTDTTALLGDVQEFDMAEAPRDLDRLQTALEVYYADHASYPSEFDAGSRLGVDVTCLGAAGFGPDVVTCTGEQGTIYMVNIPQLSFPASRYHYCEAGRYLVEYYDEQGIVHYITSGNVVQTADQVADCLDDDDDGLSNALESFYGSSPVNPDTDGDGYMDGEEVANGFDPNGPGALGDSDL